LGHWPGGGKVKQTRDATFERTNEQGVTVNRTQGFAFLGGAAKQQRGMLPASKLARALGVVNLEHQARI